MASNQFHRVRWLASSSHSKEDWISWVEVQCKSKLLLPIGECTIRSYSQWERVRSDTWRTWMSSTQSSPSNCQPHLGNERSRDYSVERTSLRIGSYSVRWYWTQEQKEYCLPYRARLASSKLDLWYTWSLWSQEGKSLSISKKWASLKCQRAATSFELSLLCQDIDRSCSLWDIVFKGVAWTWDARRLANRSELLAFFNWYRFAFSYTHDEAGIVPLFR